MQILSKKCNNTNSQGNGGKRFRLCEMHANIFTLQIDLIVSEFISKTPNDTCAIVTGFEFIQRLHIICKETRKKTGIFIIYKYLLKLSLLLFLRQWICNRLAKKMTNMSRINRQTEMTCCVLDRKSLSKFNFFKMNKQPIEYESRTNYERIQWNFISFHFRKMLAKWCTANNKFMPPLWTKT